MKYYVFAAIALFVFSIPFVSNGGQREVPSFTQAATRHAQGHLQRAIASGFRFLFREDEKEPDGGKPDPKKASREAYPSLYSEAREKGVIVIFGFPTCGPCLKFEKQIPEGYRVLKVDYREENVKGSGKTWRDLMGQWGIVYNKYPVYPTIAIVVDGKPIELAEGRHAFVSYKPWRVVEPFAKVAKKDEEKKPTPNPRPQPDPDRRWRWFRRSKTAN